jgi:hypothetical protein
MDCEEYRVAIAADPSESFDGGSAHSESCVACSELKAELRALDGQIGRALTIEVPELRLPELPPVSGRSAGAGDGQRRLALPGWFGLAAGVGAAIAVAWQALTPDPGSPSLAEQVLLHMDYEQSSRQVISVAVSDARLGEVLESRVSELDTGERIVSYAMSCVINGNTVPHLVVQGRAGPITLILLPEESIDAAIPLSGDSVHGVILPAGSGSVAIIGQREQQMPEIGEVGERVIDSVKWTI